MKTLEQFTPAEAAQLRELLAERQPVSADDLVHVLRAETATEPIVDLAGRYWRWVEQGETVTVADGRKLLAALGRTHQQLAGDLRAFRNQQQAERRQAEDRARRETRLEVAKPAHAELDKAVEALFGSSWRQLVEAGDLQPPYVVSYETGEVRTLVEAIRPQCAALESALAGIADVWRYPSVPTFLADAKRQFDDALAIRV